MKNVQKQNAQARLGISEVRIDLSSRRGSMVVTMLMAMCEHVCECVCYNTEQEEAMDAWSHHQVNLSPGVEMVKPVYIGEFGKKAWLRIWEEDVRETIQSVIMIFITV